MNACKMDCMNCKHCILKKTAYENAYTNICEFESRLDSLSDEQLLERIVNKTCEWFEKGKPVVAKGEVVYDD